MFDIAAQLFVVIGVVARLVIAPRLWR